MKKIYKKLKEKFAIVGITIMEILVFTESKILGASNTQSIDSFINFACDWLTKIRRSYCSCWWSYVCSWVAERRC